MNLVLSRYGYVFDNYKVIIEYVPKTYKVNTECVADSYNIFRVHIWVFNVTGTYKVISRYILSTGWICTWYLTSLYLILNK